MEYEHCKFYVERFLYAQDNPPQRCAIDVFCWGSFDDKTLVMLKDPNKKFYS